MRDCCAAPALLVDNDSCSEGACLSISNHS